MFLKTENEELRSKLLEPEKIFPSSKILVLYAWE